MGRNRIIVLTFILLLPGFGTSEAVSGGDLLDHCNDKSTFHHGYCYGFIQGTIEYNALADYVLLEKKMLKSPKNCIGSGVSLEKSVEVVIEYLKNNSGKLNQHAGNLVLLAIDEAFPCPVAKGK
jgi:Rap1a immunity proteins